MFKAHSVRRIRDEKEVVKETLLSHFEEGMS
jgi:hypothetical protein